MLRPETVERVPAVSFVSTVCGKYAEVAHAFECQPRARLFVRSRHDQWQIIACRPCPFRRTSLRVVRAARSVCVTLSQSRGPLPELELCELELEHRRILPSPATDLHPTRQIWMLCSPLSDLAPPVAYASRRTLYGSQQHVSRAPCRQESIAANGDGFTVSGRTGYAG